MLRMRSIVTIGLVMLIMLAGCAPAAPAEQAAAPAQPAAAEGVTTITWLTLDWNGVQDVIDVFEAENPDINVEAEMVPFNSLFEQIQVRLGAGATDPDVLSVDVPLVTGYGLRGWLLPVGDVFTEDEKADWLEAAMAAGMYEGELIAPPVNTSTNFLFYNADLFARAGITPPTEEERWTFEYIAEIAPRFTFDDDGDGVTDVWGFTWEQTNRIYQLQPMPEGLGGDAIGPDGLTVDGVINSQPWIDAFTYYSRMFNEWKAAPPDDTVPAPICLQPASFPCSLRPVEHQPLHPRRSPVRLGRLPPSLLRERRDRDPHRQLAHRRQRQVRRTGSGGALRALANHRQGRRDLVAHRQRRLPREKSVLALFNTDEQFAEPPMSYFKMAADEATVNPVPRGLSPGFLEYEQILQNTFTDIRTGADVEEALNLAVERINSEMVKYTR